MKTSPTPAGRTSAKADAVQKTRHSAVRPAAEAVAASSAAADAADAAQQREAAIQAIAFALYQARGNLQGHDLEDWLQAEAQVNQASGPGLAAGTTAAAWPNH